MTGDREPGITVERIGEVTVIAMNRPHKRNALRLSDWAAINNALVEANADPAVRAIIITGRGGTFSAGFDLRSDSKPAGMSTLPTVKRTLLELYRCSKPTIAAVDGACIAAAWSLALSCDMLVAAEDAFFEPPFASRGLVYDAGIQWFLAERLGRFETARLYLMGGRYTAAQAFGHGLASEIVSTGQALSRSQAIAEMLVKLPSTAVAVSKAALRRAVISSLEQTLDGEESDVTLNAIHHESVAARESFMERLGGVKPN